MTAFTGGGFGFPGGGRGGRGRGGANAPPPQPMSTLRTGSGGALRTLVHDSGERARHASRTGTGKARPDVTRSTPMRRSASRCGRRRTRCRSRWRCRGAKRSSTACRCSIGTKATCSAVRSGPSCWWFRRCRYGCRRRSRSSLPRPSAARAAGFRQRHGRGGASGLRSGATVGGPGDSGDRRQRHGRSSRHDGAPGSTARLERHAGLAADHVRARRRIPDGALRCQAGADRDERRVPHPRDCDVERADVRSRLRGDRVPAHPPLSHLRQRGGDAESDRRADSGEPEDRLRDGRRRPGPARHRTAGRDGRDDQPGRSRVGQAVAVRRHRHRRPRLRAP